MYQLAELNQNWLCGQNLWHAIFQGYRIGGRITALGKSLLLESGFSNDKQPVYSLYLACCVAL